MKIFNKIIGMILLIVLLSCQAKAGDAEAKMDDKSTMKPAFIDRNVRYIESSRKYTLEVAEAMPAEKYGYKPHAESRTFGEQMQHIAGGVQFQLGLIKSKGVPPEGFDPTAKMPEMSKEEIIKMINSAYDMFKMTVENSTAASLDEKLTLAFIPNHEFDMYGYFEFMLDHITHHRGQAIVYLRANDIKPPSYQQF